MWRESTFRSYDARGRIFLRILMRMTRKEQSCVAGNRPRIRSIEIVRESQPTDYDTTLFLTSREAHPMTNR